MNFSVVSLNIDCRRFCLTLCLINTLSAGTLFRFGPEPSNRPISSGTAQKPFDYGQSLTKTMSLTANLHLHSVTHSADKHTSAARPLLKDQLQHKGSLMYSPSAKDSHSLLFSLHRQPDMKQLVDARRFSSQNGSNVILPNVTDRPTETDLTKDMHRLRKKPLSTALLHWTSNQQRGQNASTGTHHLESSSDNKQNQKQTHPSGDNYKVELVADQTEHFPIAVEKCSNGRKIIIKGHSGIVYFVSNRTPDYVVQVCCSWEIAVKEGRFLAVRFESILPVCKKARNVYIKVRDTYSEDTIGQLVHCGHDSLMYSSNNLARVKGCIGGVNVTFFYLFFTTLSRNAREELPAFMTSLTTGYVISPGFGGKAYYPSVLNASYDLVVPPDHAVMTSFPRVEFSVQDACLRIKLLIYEVRNKTRQLVARICEPDNIKPQLYNSSLALKIIAQGDYTYNRGSGFRMDFSFHPASEAPVMYKDGLFNCSTPTYNAFKQHVHCNLEHDCAGGEDERGHCPFSSSLCNGGVALGTKCYKSFENKTPLTCSEADQACKNHGGILAILRTAQGREALRKIFDVGRWWSAGYVGLTSARDRLPYMYRDLLVWSDGVVVYDVNYDRHFCKKECACVSPSLESYKQALRCFDRQYQRYFCEFDVEGERKASARSPRRVALPVNALWSEYTITQCPPGHVTFTFLSCDPTNECGAQIIHKTSCTTLYPATPDVSEYDQNYARAFRVGQPNMRKTENNSTKGSISVTVWMFSCVDSRSTVSYSLVCDCATDCNDGSDETFCKHAGKCPHVTCKNGQCFSSAEKYSKVVDCGDSSPLPFIRLPPPSVVDFDGNGDFTQRPIQKSEACPETHFRCSGFESHCLPVYVLCNGVYDCPGREDEEDCDHNACPGFYRCRNSRVCIHSDYMCDSWPQCPQNDDELYCGLTCPTGCLCQGMAFVCSTTFPAHACPHMRYLNANRSKMKPMNLLHNIYLIWLSMAFCNIEQISELTWPNLIYLYLNQNYLKVVNMDSFRHLANLRTLILANNPLISLVRSSICSSVSAMKTLDISKTMLQEYDSDALLCHGQISELNISHCPLDEITDRGFKATPYLTNIDLTGSPVLNFPRDIFKGLKRLTTIFADNYKLCCKSTLPSSFDERFCFAPQDEISSCDDLLKSDFYRGCIWIFAAFAVSGNCGCFLIKLLYEGKSQHSGFNVFVINLSVADLLMGVYLVIVGVADEIYGGQYLWFEKTWKTSAACSAAGFLSLLSSSEVSAFFICLITLDRFIALTFPFSDVRFRRRSAGAACSLVWVAGALLASVPLFPRTPMWDFYGRTGICIPLPITRASFPGHHYAFGVMVILNFIIFVLIAAGQASVYRSVRMNTMVADTSRKSKDLVIARCLLSVAASDFLCWFPIGFLGLASSKGVSVSSEVRVAMAIFVLPLNSAINPFLYTFNVLMERRRKARETQLMKMLEKKLMSQKAIN